MRCLSVLAVAILVGSIGVAHAKLPDIDSSDWAADPVDHGMTAAEYINAEMHAFYAEFIGRAGINKFSHFKTLATPEDTWVVSPNLDTLYSIAIVNVTEGFTLEIPDTGKRFLSIQITDENHITPLHLYGGGVRKFTADQFETDYVGIGLRIGTDGTPEDIAKIVETIQLRTKITGAKEVDSFPRPDLKVLLRVREAMIVQYSKLSNTFGVMQTHTKDVKDWEVFTYTTAGALGLSSDEHAMYAISAPEGAVGGECWIATFPPVPANEFFSVTVYGPDKHLMTNQNNIVSSIRGAVTEPDGSFAIVFGGEQCRDKAPNWIHTPKDGWSLLLRAYRPRVEEFKAYQMPTLRRID